MDTAPMIKISDILPSLGPISLPLDGFIDKTHHIFVTTPYLRERMAHITLKDAALATINISNDLSNAVSNGISNIINNQVDPENFNIHPQSQLPPVFDFVRKILRVSGIYTFTMNTLNYLSSFHFFGVQPQPFKGFTCYINKNLDSNEDSNMHYALSPTEFLLYGMKVNSVCDGIVSEIRNDAYDQLRNKPPVAYSTWKIDEHLGNFIKVQKGFVEITYGGLMKDSILVKPGDKIFKAQNIARVGCSAWSSIPFLYLQLGLKNARVPIVGSLAPSFHHQIIKWDAHLQCRLFKSPILDKMDSHTDIFKNVDITKIEYKPFVTQVFDGSLVKSYRIRVLQD